MISMQRIEEVANVRDNDKIEVLKMCVYDFFWFLLKGLKAKRKAEPDRHTQREKPMNDEIAQLTVKAKRWCERFIMRAFTSTSEHFFSVGISLSLLASLSLAHSLLYFLCAHRYRRVCECIFACVVIVVAVVDAIRTASTAFDGVCDAAKRPFKWFSDAIFGFFLKQETRYITVARKRYFVIKEVAKNTSFFHFCGLAPALQMANTVAQNNHRVDTQSAREVSENRIRGGSVTFNASNKSALKIAQPQTISFDSLS